MESSNNNSDSIKIDDIRRSIKEVQETINKLHDNNDAPYHISHMYKLELELLSNKLSREIKHEFFESIKRWLWVFTLIIAFATAGGYLQLSGFIKSQIDEKIKEKEADIAGIRRDIMKELVDFERRSQEAIAKIDILENQIANRSQNAIVTIEKSINNVAYFESIIVKKRKTGGFSVIPKHIKVSNPIFGSLPPDFISISASQFGTSGKTTTKGSLFSISLAKLTDNFSVSDVNDDGLVSMEEVSFFTSKFKESENPKNNSPSDTYFTSSMDDIALFSVNRLKEEKKPVKKLWLIIVAVGEYQNQRANIPGILNDAENIKKLFTSDNLLAQNINIVELINQDATMLSIEKAIQEISVKISKDDIFVFYYSGHGTQAPNSKNKMKTVILPYDFSINNNKISLKKYIVVPDLVKKISDIQAKAKIVILDI